MKNLLLVFLLLLAALAAAQEGRRPAIDYLRAHANELGVTVADLSELRITDRYTSTSSGVEHVYLQQQLFGTPVYNATASVHFRRQRPVYRTSRLQASLRERAQTVASSLDAATARRALPAGLRIEEEGLLYYAATPELPLYLTYSYLVERLDDGLHFMYLIDATTGRILLEEQLTVECTSGGAAMAGGSPTRASFGKPAAAERGRYRVFPFGLESPLNGERTLVRAPELPLASPYGWHDIDGATGAEFTTTRGNNVVAYLDAAEPFNEPDTGFVADGGEELVFDFPLAEEQPPDSSYRAALTQLFYTNNMLHDWTAYHGFDEAAGNFQVTNYTGRGEGEDAVRAEALDGGRFNNATMFTPSEGRPPRMQMHLWLRQGQPLRVTAPDGLARAFSAGLANFGPSLPAEAIRAPLAIGSDGTSLGCDALTNADELGGKIVLLDRGSCFFQQKVYRAEQAGAVAVIICNTNDGLLNMGAISDSNDFPVGIPSILMRRSDCAPLKEAIRAGQTVQAELREDAVNPVASDYDNGIVAHEYAHGVSNRLVGGPGITSCLNNLEQMGEGWSDFFALATTPQAAGAIPDGREPRGVGSYASGDSLGIRSQPYSTDPTVNTLTYDDIITARIPHGLGELWAATLWDLYWAMVKRYGFDSDLITGDGGNNAAVRLVIEGMKYTPCSPGMLDARDGILIADQFEHDGANRCLLWEVFRRRGLGEDATQEDPALHNDGREGFLPRPACIPTVKLAKTPDTTYVEAGETFGYTLSLRNDKDEAVSDIVVQDELPEGLSLLPASLPDSLTYRTEGRLLIVELGTLAAGARKEVSYRVRTAGDRGSVISYRYGVEDEPADVWTTTAAADSAAWRRVDTFALDGNHAWFVPAHPAAHDSRLRLSLPDTLRGARPALRFFTHYDTEPAYDAGVVELRRRGEPDWLDAEGRFLRHGYRGEIDPVNGAPTLRNRPSFWGRNDSGYTEVVLDLSELSGQAFDARWRYVSDATVGYRGWWIDGVEVYDELFTYNGGATLTTAEGDVVAAVTPPAGVIVGHVDPTTPVGDPTAFNSFTVFPNPVADRLTVEIGALPVPAVALRMLGPRGRVLRERSVEASRSPHRIEIDVRALPAGPYLLSLTDVRGGVATRRFVVAR